MYHLYIYVYTCLGCLLVVGGEEDGAALVWQLAVVLVYEECVYVCMYVYL